MSNKIFTTIKSFVKDIPTYWNKPPENRYVSYKEFAAYSFGGIGVNTINSLFGYVALSANCMLVGTAYGIDPVHLGWMATFVSILNLIKTPFVSMLIDNTDTKYGKFRPYLLLMGIPTAILICLMAFIPESFSYTAKCLTLCAIYSLAMIFQSIYAFSFTSLAQVLTPDSDERTSLLSISQFIYSLGPSIVNIILPVFAGFFPDGMKGFTAYRILFPIFSVVGILLSIWTFKDTREKIIVPKTYVAKVKFKDGIKSLYKNKYFWLYYLYSILGCMKYSMSGILVWYCMYVIQSDAVYGVLNAVFGFASVPGMLTAPLLAKKIGKRNCLLLFNIVRTVFAILMLFTSNIPILFMICYFLTTLAIGGDGVISASVTADIFDYQQWQTGQRLEGFISQFGSMMVTAVSLCSGLILPYFYRYYGLGTDYSVLLNESIRTPIFNVMIIISIISCVAAIIPIFFYDLTAEKLKSIAADLEERKSKSNIE